MLKKVFLAAALSVAVVGLTATAAPTEAYACKSGCWKKAKAMYPHDWKARHAYKKACKRAWRAAHRRRGLFR